MKQSETSLLHNAFSHVYVEKQALDFPATKIILESFPHALIVEIEHYKDFFCRSGQDFQLQKSSQKLILAVRKDKFIYEGADVCHSFGHSSFYYTSSILNCIYNCDYCYLQGMLPSGNMVVFVNLEDYLSRVDALLKSAPLYLTVSYDTDLLAFENIYPFTSGWIEYAGKKEGLTMEIRTKSVNYKAISRLKPYDNVILAWTISPDSIIAKYEKNTPSLEARLGAIKEAASDGWKVRLCFDPMILTDNWQGIYEECIRKIFNMVRSSEIDDVSIGVFRMASHYLKKIRKNRLDSSLIHYPFDCRDGICSYPEEIKRELIYFVRDELSAHIDKRRIFIL